MKGSGAVLLSAAVGALMALSGAADALVREATLATSPALENVAPRSQILGDPAAEHTIVVYMPMICDNCSSWYESVLPALRSEFLDTGRAALIFRNVPTTPVEYSGPAAGLTICAAEDRFFDVVDVLLKGEKAVREGASISEWQDAGVAASGRTRAQIEACLSDPNTLVTLHADVDAANAAGVFNPPAAVVDGILLTRPSFDNIRAVIESTSAGAVEASPDPASDNAELSIDQAP